MKKYLFLILAILFLTPALASAYTYNRNPSGTGEYSSVEITSTITQADCGGSGSITEYAIILVGAGLDTDIDYNTGNIVGDGFVSSYYPIGSTQVTTFNSNEGEVYAVGYACHHDETPIFPTNYYVYQNDFEGDWENIQFTIYEGVSVLGFSSMIDDAKVGFASTTGFGVGSVVVWAGDSFIKLFIGSGLAVLYNLRYWIMALVIIYLIVFFGYRAYKFFRH